MENYRGKSKRLAVKSIESVIGQKFSVKVHKKSNQKIFHQPFCTHTKKLREGQIPRIIKQVAGKSDLSVQNFLWRYNSKEKASWIR